MKQGERGIILIELTVSVAIAACICCAAAALIYQFSFTENNNAHMTAVEQARSAGYWLSNDAYMADNIIAENLTFPTLLVLKWTDWGYGSTNVYYSASYSLENISDNVGQLKRHLQSSSGIDQQTMVASYIYYNAADNNSTGITYQAPFLNLKVAAQFGKYNEVKTYKITCRPNF